MFRHTIRFPGQERRAAPAKSLAIAPTTGAAEDIAAAPTEAVAVTGREQDSDAEAAMGNASTRNLVFRFWNLTNSQRREITLRLGLISENELRVPEPERYGRALIRAGEQGKIDELAREIAQKERH